MTQHARGSFDVKITPSDLQTAAPALAVWTLDKQFHGPLTASSAGHMLSFGNPAAGPAAYVAIEVVAGTLDGRKGTFALQHRGHMRSGESHLEVTVVPGSGTEELNGLSGSMQIIIEQGAHSYDFEYSFDL